MRGTTELAPWETPDARGAPARKGRGPIHAAKEFTLSLSPTSSSSRTRPRRAGAGLSLAAVTVVAAASLTGCGTTPPAYCSARTDLENAVKGLPEAAKTGGVSGLQSQLKTVEADANTVIDKAKSDFPTQTEALKSTIGQFKTSIQTAGTSPSAADLAPIVLNATAVVNAVKAFTGATKDKC